MKLLHRGKDAFYKRECRYEAKVGSRYLEQIPKKVSAESDREATHRPKNETNKKGGVREEPQNLAEGARVRAETCSDGDDDKVRKRGDHDD